jgi:tetratricopeptide (TPR) repeat protein
MSDHGVALLTGKRLVEWLQVPKNVAALPRFLQKQLQLGFQISSDLSAADLASTIDGCLTRSRAWVDAYERFMREASVEEYVPEPATLVQLALAEARYAESLWNRDYAGAAEHLQRTLEDAGNFSVSTVCWHKLWLAFALECAGDAETARALYQQAHGGQRNIPPFRTEAPSAATASLPAQAVSASRQFELSGDGRVRVPRSLDRDLLYLDGTGTPRQSEEALRCLGQYLGLQATRPDNEHGTGPDVLWLCPDTTAICVDAKTDKEAGGVYRKDELGQLADHVQWVRDNVETEEIIPGFVGPEVPASDSANPQEGVKIASLAKFHAIGETLKAAYRDVAAASHPLTIGQAVSEEFAKRDLLWPQLQQSVNFVELRELHKP